MLCRVLCALIFIGLTAEQPVEFDPVLFSGYWRSPFKFLGPLVVSLPGIRLWAWQLLFFAAAPLCLLRTGASRARAWPMDAAVIASLTSCALTFAWGQLNGGGAYYAYYQLWRFLMALLLAFILPSVIHSARDLRAVGTTILAAAVIRGALTIYFYWFHVRGKIDPLPEYLINHDDSVLFVAGLLIAVSWMVVRMRPAAWLLAAPPCAVVLYAMVLNDRRIVWVELLLALGIMYLMLPKGRLRRTVTVMLPVLLLVGLAYLAVGRSRPGAFFAPARSLATMGSYEDPSSLARQEEIRNLLHTLTVAGNPVLGTGWGVPYIKVSSLYSSFEGWDLYLYTPHNSLLGVAVFGGLVGIFGIWLVVPMAAFLGVRGFRGSTRNVERAAALAGVCVLPAYSAQCFGDIGLQSITCGLILGTALGVTSRVWAWSAMPSGGGRRRRPQAIATAGDELPSDRPWA